MNDAQVFQLVGGIFILVLLFTTLMLSTIFYMHKRANKELIPECSHVRAIAKKAQSEEFKITFSTFKNHNITLIVDKEDYVNINEGEEYWVTHINGKLIQSEKV